MNTTKAYLFVGSDDYARRVAARECVNALIPGDQKALGLEIVEGDVGQAPEARVVLETCLGALQTRGFLSTGKLVWLKEATFLGNASICAEDAVRTRLEALADMIANGLGEQSLVLSAPKVDSSSALFRAFERHGTVRQFVLPDKTWRVRREALDHVRAVMAAERLTAEAAVVEALVDRVGTDRAALENEVKKLAAFLGGERREVDLNDVRTLSAASAEVLAWDLLDAVSEADGGRALKTLDRLLLQRERAMKLILQLYRRFTELGLYQQGLACGWLKLTSGIHPQARWVPGLPESARALLKEAFERDPREKSTYYVTKLAQQAQTNRGLNVPACQSMLVGACEQLVASGAPEQRILEMLVIRLLQAKKD